YRQGRGCLRDYPDGERRYCDTAQRGVPGRRVASAGVASAAEVLAAQMGIDAVSRAAIFLDRDGVLNRTRFRNGKPIPPQSLGELEILPGVPEALGSLRAAGYALLVVTNQPDIARGATTRATVEDLHRFLREQLPID